MSLNNYIYPLLSGILINAYAFIMSLDLFKTWSSSPYDKYGIIFFFIWFIPAIIHIFLLLKKIIKLELNFYFLISSIVLTMLGHIGSLNILGHIGLAFSITGFFYINKLSSLWLLSSISWMPFFSWYGSKYFSNYIYIPKTLFIVIFFFIYFIFFIKKNTPDHIDNNN